MVLVTAVAILVVGRTVLMPLAFALVFALWLHPLVNRMEAVLPRLLAILLASGGLTALLATILILVGFAIRSVAADLDFESMEAPAFLEDALAWIRDQLGLEGAFDPGSILDRLPSDVLSGPLTVLGDQVGQITEIGVGLTLTGVFTVLLLLYRSALHRFARSSVQRPSRSDFDHLMGDLASVVRGYMTGKGLSMLAVGVLNGLGLWILGVDHAWVWGLLAVVLCVVPYIGTFTAGFLPFVYAVFTSGTVWQPLAVVALFTSVQMLEEYVLVPRIVGKRVDLNPLFAIIALIVGAMIWGVGGMILALIYAGFLKDVLSQFRETHRLGALMSTGIDTDTDRVSDQSPDRPTHSLRAFIFRS